MVTQQEKKMLWECFGKGSGAENRRSAHESRNKPVVAAGEDFANAAFWDRGGLFSNRGEELPIPSRGYDLPTLTKVTGAKK